MNSKEKTDPPYYEGLIYIPYYLKQLGLHENVNIYSTEFENFISIITYGTGTKTCRKCVYFSPDRGCGEPEGYQHDNAAKREPSNCIRHLCGQTKDHCCPYSDLIFYLHFKKEVEERKKDIAEDDSQDNNLKKWLGRKLKEKEEAMEYCENKLIKELIRTFPDSSPEELMNYVIDEYYPYKTGLGYIKEHVTGPSHLNKHQELSN